MSLSKQGLRMDVCGGLAIVTLVLTDQPLCSAKLTELVFHFADVHYIIATALILVYYERCL